MRKFLGNSIGVSWIILFLWFMSWAEPLTLLQKVVGVVYILGVPAVAAGMATRLWFVLYATPLPWTMAWIFVT